MARQSDTLPGSLPVLSAVDGCSCVACCVRVSAGRDRLQRDLMRNTRRFTQMQMGGPRAGRLKTLRYHLVDGGWVTYLLAGVLSPLTFGASLWLWRRWIYTACPYAGFLDERNSTPGCLIHPLRQTSASDRRRTEPWYLIPWLTCDSSYQCAAFTAPWAGGEDSLDWYELTVQRNKALRIADCGFRISDCVEYGQL